MEDNEKDYLEETDYNLNDEIKEENITIQERRYEVPRHAAKTKTKVKKVKDKKNNKKKKIIIIVSIIAVLLIGVLAFFLLTKDDKKVVKEKPIKPAWGQTYYTYLKNVNKNEKYEAAGLPEEMEYAKINFYEIKDIEDPIMAISYKLDKKQYTNIYFIENKKVDSLVLTEPATVDLLYNIEKRKYAYYTEEDTNDDGNADIYKLISDQIKEKIKQQKTGTISSDDNAIEVYSFTDDDKDVVVDVNNNELTLTKFDQTLIKIDTKDKGVSYNFDLTDKELRKAIEKEMKNFKEVEDIVTDKVEKVVDKKIKNIESKKEEMEKAKAEVDQKNAEEKAKKEAEDKARKEKEAGIKVGNYTLKYGTYKGKDGNEGNTIVLNQDGKCSYNGSSCTYSTGSHDFNGNTKDSIIIKADSTMYLYPYSGSEIGDGDGSYTYSS